MENKTKALLSVALTTLLVTASGCATTGAASGDLAKGECHGINSCKGKGECGGTGYSCAGNNACKGQGWVTLTQADCTAKAGTFKSK